MRNSTLALGAIGFSSSSVLAQVAAGPVTDPTSIDTLIRLGGQLGAPGCLCVLCWFLYQDAARLRESYGAALAEKERAHGEAVAAERQLRINDAEAYANQLEALREDAAEEKRRFMDAHLEQSKPRPRPPAATKKKKR